MMAALMFLVCLRSVGVELVIAFLLVLTIVTGVLGLEIVVIAVV